jgi:hypothetical protein
MCLIMESGALSVIFPTKTVTAGPDEGSGARLVKVALVVWLLRFGLNGALMTGFGGGPLGSGGGISCKKILLNNLFVNINLNGFDLHVSAASWEVALELILECLK